MTVVNTVLCERVKLQKALERFSEDSEVVNADVIVGFSCQITDELENVP